MTRLVYQRMLDRAVIGLAILVKQLLTLALTNWIVAENRATTFDDHDRRLLIQFSVLCARAVACRVEYYRKGSFALRHVKCRGHVQTWLRFKVEFLNAVVVHR